MEYLTPAILLPTQEHPVCQVKRFYSAGINPVSLKNVISQFPYLDVLVVHACYLVLAAGRRLYLPYYVENFPVVHVISDDSEVRLGVLWLFLDAYHMPLVKGSNSVSCRI